MSCKNKVLRNHKLAKGNNVSLSFLYRQIQRNGFGKAYENHLTGNIRHQNQKAFNTLPKLLTEQKSMDPTNNRSALAGTQKDDKVLQSIVDKFQLK